MNHGRENGLPAAFMHLRSFWNHLGILTIYLVLYTGLHELLVRSVVNLNEENAEKAPGTFSKSGTAIIYNLGRMLQDINAYPIYERFFLMQGDRVDNSALLETDIEVLQEDGEECNLRFSDGAFHDICVISL